MCGAAGAKARSLLSLDGTAEAVPFPYLDDVLDFGLARKKQIPHYARNDDFIETDGKGLGVRLPRLSSKVRTRTWGTLDLTFSGWLASKEA